MNWIDGSRARLSISSWGFASASFASDKAYVSS